MKDASIAGVVFVLLMWGSSAAAQSSPAGQAVPETPPPASAAPQTPPTGDPAAPPVEGLGEEHRVKVEEIDALLAKGDVFFLDVREPRELEELGTLEGYVNIPLGQIESRLSELPRDKAILTA